MKYLVLSLVFAAGFATAHLTGFITAADPQPVPPPTTASPNPNIDMDGFVKAARAAADHRRSRLLSEEEFIKMSQEEGVIILDARSKEMYDILHVKGAINLNFSNIDIVSLPQTLPDKNAKILIYCNNNFMPASGILAQGANQPVNPINAKVELAMRPKSPALSLNLSTQTALLNYGYKNVYELAPLVDPAKTKIPLVSNKK